MAINPFIRQNLAYDTINTPFTNESREQYFIRNTNNPADQIDLKNKNTAIDFYQYPSDLPRYHFVIIECDWSAGGVAGPGAPGTKPKLSFTKMYKLPLPAPLNEAYQINYDGGGNWLSMLSGAVDTVAQFTGLTVNDLKSVTLKSPQYRVINHIWKLSPKSFNESKQIKNIIFHMKKGMHPQLNTYTSANTPVLLFPKIYLLFFVPNMRYLYKFKPCVIQALSVDYQGGNKVPSFFRSEDSGTTNASFGEGQSLSYQQQDSPPESIELRVQWLELEYWISGINGKGQFGDFQDTNSPFDAFNWFNNANSGPQMFGN